MMSPAMSATRTTVAYAIAIIVGMSLWYWASISSNRREAWDAAAYWTFAYPIAIAVAGVMGYLFPERPWRWALTLFLGQFLAMVIRNGELGSMWPMGMVLMVVLSLPGMLVGKLAARLHNKRSSEKKE